MQTEQIIFRNTYICTYTFMCTITINENRGQKFERERGRVWENLKGGKGRNK